VNYTLQQLRYLVAVADHGSVSAAARSLYVSQPGVSAAVSYLESTFGIQCFVRHHAKGVTLTPAGKSFVAAARDVLVLAEELHQRANELSHTVRGRVSVGCGPTLSYFFLPKVLEIFGAAYPDINLQIHVGHADSVHHWLRNGTVEIALMYDLNCDSVVYSKHHLTSFTPHALLPQSHPLGAKASVELDELVDEPLILMDSGLCAEYVLTSFQNIQKRPNIKHRVSNVELIRGLISAGRGYSIFNVRPAFDSAKLDSPVKWIPISGENRPVSVALVSMHTVKSSIEQAALIDACHAAMQRVEPERCKLAS
jgi:DNA-binding transcriptional LysR family regulator